MSGLHRPMTLREIARRLDGAGVPWAVFAGAAAVAYGARRPLTDIDILVPAAESARVVGLFPEAEVRRYGEDLLQLVLPGFDLLAGLALVDLDASMAARLTSHNLGGVMVPIIPPEDNILLKAVWARGADQGKHDWEDVEAMVARGPDLDWEYLCWRADTFPLASRVEQVLERLDRLRSQQSEARTEAFEPKGVES